MVSITIPQKMSVEIDAIIDTGYYDNRSEFIQDAIRMYLAQKPEMRLVAAVELYRQDKITLSRAAEIAGLSFEGMKSILQDEGILRRGKSSPDRKRKGMNELVS